MRYEYKTLHLGGWQGADPVWHDADTGEKVCDKMADVTPMLNKYGAEGWEMKGAAHSFIFLQRPARVPSFLEDMKRQLETKEGNSPGVNEGTERPHGES